MYTPLHSKTLVRPSLPPPFLHSLNLFWLCFTSPSYSICLSLHPSVLPPLSATTCSISHLCYMVLILCCSGAIYPVHLNMCLCMRTRTLTQCRYVDQDTFFRESDIMSLHVPLFPSTYHIINKCANFNKLGRARWTENIVKQYEACTAKSVYLTLVYHIFRCCLFFCVSLWW